MVVWIVVAAVVLGLVYLAVVGRALGKRMAALKAEQDGLIATAERAQELAQVAQGLEAHASSLQTRAELIQENLETIKARMGQRSSNPG